MRPLRRRRRQSSSEGNIYITAQNRISLSFTTEQSSGALLQLGDPESSSEYMLLLVCDTNLEQLCRALFTTSIGSKPGKASH